MKEIVFYGTLFPKIQRERIWRMQRQAYGQRIPEQKVTINALRLRLDLAIHQQPLVFNDA